MEMLKDEVKLKLQKILEKELFSDQIANSENKAFKDSIQGLIRVSRSIFSISDEFFKEYRMLIVMENLKILLKKNNFFSQFEQEFDLFYKNKANKEKIFNGLLKSLEKRFGLNNKYIVINQ